MGQYMLQQFAYAGPVLVVYFVGMILSVIFLRKSPGAATLALAATLILFFTGLGVTMTQGYFFRMRYESGWTPAQYAQMSNVISIVGTILRTFGSALLVAAVFVGRKSPSAATA